jgi:dihydropyrimidinase
VIFDPRQEWVLGTDTLHSPVDWTPYDGMKVKGRVTATLSRGELIVRDGVFLGRPGKGRYLERSLSL